MARFNFAQCVLDKIESGMSQEAALAECRAQMEKESLAEANKRAREEAIARRKLKKRQKDKR